jgi:hypothetical protein
LSIPTEHPLVDLRHSTAELKVIRKADVPQIDFDTPFMIKKAPTYKYEELFKEYLKLNDFKL